MPVCQAKSDRGVDRAVKAFCPCVAPLAASISCAAIRNLLPTLCLSEIKSGHMMQSAEDRAAKNTPCEQREVTEAGQQAVGQVVLHIVRHVGTHDLDRGDVTRAPSSWAPRRDLQKIP